MAPTWVFLKKLSDGSNATQPAIIEVASGQYKLAFDPEVNGESSGQVDLGGAVANPSDRFIDLVFYLSDSRTTVNLDAAVSSRSTQVLANPGQPIVTDTAGRVTLAASGLDAIPVEPGVNVRQALSPILASAAGVLLGAGTGTIFIKGGNNNATRITASTDNAGNRTAVSLALPI